jgi:hypothetical protein
VPIIAWTDRVVIARNPGITIPGCRVGGSGVAIDRNRRRRGIIVTATETDAEKDSGTSEHASASQQKKRQDFCFHVKLLATLICKSFAKLKWLKNEEKDEAVLAFVHHCGGFKPLLRRAPLLRI